MGLGGADEDGGVACVIAVGVKVVTPQGVVGDSMEVVQSASVGGKGGVADAGEGGEGSSSGKARRVVLVGFVTKGIVVIDTGVEGGVTGGDAGVHGMEGLEGVAKGHYGGEGVG